MYEKPEAPPIPKIYEIDISKGWDTESQIEEFHKGLKKLPFYKPGLLYSGFDGEQIGISWKATDEDSDEPEKPIVYCNTEDKINYDEDRSTNPFYFALEYNTPAIAVYDPKKLEENVYKGYIIKDKTALIAIIKFKI